MGCDMDIRQIFLTHDTKHVDSPGAGTVSDGY